MVSVNYECFFTQLPSFSCKGRENIVMHETEYMILRLSLVSESDSVTFFVTTIPGLPYIVWLRNAVSVNVPINSALSHRTEN